MIIEGYGKPTATSGIELGTIYTDLDTGKQYELIDYNFIGNLSDKWWKTVNPNNYKYSSSGSCDWNTMENRPFGDEPEVFSITVGAEESVMLEGFPLFNIGDTVSITIDGVEYSLVAFEDMGVPTIGEAGDDLYDGQGFEWAAASIDIDGCVYFYTTQGCVVSYRGAKITTVPERWLPNVKKIDGVPVIFFDDIHSKLKLLSVTIGEITENNDYPTIVPNTMTVEDFDNYAKILEGTHILLTERRQMTCSTYSNGRYINLCFWNMPSVSHAPVGNGSYYPTISIKYTQVQLTVENGSVVAKAGVMDMMNAPYASSDRHPMLMLSPNGTRYKVTINDDGTLSTSAV